MKTLSLISNAESSLSIATYFGRTADEFPSTELDLIYGVGCWVCCDADELPADFSVDTYTIVDGSLVVASVEVIAERAVAALAEQNAAIRETRRQLYDDPQGKCAPLYWNWVESQLPSDFDAWVAAKNKVREQNPYVTAKFKI